MIQSAIRQLQDTNTGVRRDAVMMLGRIADPDALDALAEVVRRDPDPTVRELARKAGQHIKAKNMTMKFKDQPASPAQRERALAFLNEALDWETRGSKARALDALGKAFESDPNLRHDTMAANLASKLTDMSADAAVLLVADPIRRGAMIEMQGGGSGGASDAADVGAGRALFDLLIYGLANGALAFIGVTFLFQAIITALGTVMPGTSGLTPADLEQFTGSAAAGSAAIGVFYGVVYAIFSIIALLILDVAIHLSATTVMGGDGTLAGLIHKTTLFYTVMIPVSIVVGMLPLLGLLEPRYAGLLTFVNYAVGILTLVWSGKLIGDAYDFGTGKGCVSMLLGTISLGLIFVCCTATLGVALSNVVNTASFGP
jgi:hypothetical protein